MEIKKILDKKIITLCVLLSPFLIYAALSEINAYRYKRPIPFRIAVISKDFCTNSQTLLSIKSSLKILKTYDATKSSTLNCVKNNLNGNIGESIVSKIAKNISNKATFNTSFEIIPINTFNTIDEQILPYWKKAIKYANDTSADLIFITHGHMSTKEELPFLPRINTTAISISDYSASSKRDAVYSWPSSKYSKQQFIELSSGDTSTNNFSNNISRGIKLLNNSANTCFDKISNKKKVINFHVEFKSCITKILKNNKL